MLTFSIKQGNIAAAETDCIVVNLFAGVTTPGGATGAVDQALDGAIRRLIAGGDFTGEAGTSALLYTQGALPAPRVLVVGLGPAAEFDLAGVRRAGAEAAKRLAGIKGVTRFATIVHGAGIGGLDAAAAARTLTEGVRLALYQAPQYRREEKAASITSCTLVEFSPEKLDAIEQGVVQGEIVADAVCDARDWVSEPGNVLYPAAFARRVEARITDTGLKMTVLGEEELRELGMNIFLAVSAGSEREAQLLVLEHAPAGTEDDAPLVLVGKGVTFDTGGISLKPGAEMWRMKSDMGGAAAVMAALEAVARLDVPKRVIGVAPCVENMPDGRAYRPGDIFTGINGKTTEIISTDAEGRLALADALGYVARYEPRAVVDLATLTGAVSIALGQGMAAGLFANDDALRDGLLAAAEQSSERLWPLPLYDEYKESIKSDMAEVKNGAGRFSGVGSSAKFLEHFTEGYPWAHLDIAGMAWASSSPNPFTPAGAVGFGVRLLIDFVNAY
ncbi:MAG: leucyl aminopeptidase [Caldilineaceae bacterium]|nr:leucyl aminopeptidase [Caldilineaceae bacterium]